MEEKKEVMTDTTNEETELEQKPKKGKRVVFVIILIILIIALVGVYFYFNNNKKEDTKVDTDKKDVSKYVLKDNSLQDFDLRFLQLENKEVNKIYSPLSIKYTLGMLNEGTKGETHSQISNIIGEYKANKYVNSQNMSFANAMFVKEAYKDQINSEYIDAIQNKFGAEVQYDPFTSAGNVNQWISQKTLGLINNMLDDETVQSLDYMLVNALGIDMQWVYNLQSEANGGESLYYDVDYRYEDYSDYIVPIDSGGYPSLGFNGSTKESKAVQIGASFNRYDIIKDLGEDGIKNKVAEEFNKYKASEECTGEYKMDDCDVSVEEMQNRYLTALKDNYGKEDISTDFFLNDTDEVKVFAKNLREYNGTTLQYVAVMPKQEKLTDFVDKMDANKIDELIAGLKDTKVDNFKDGVITQITGFIPLFNFEYDLDLMNDLKSMGVEDVFDIKKADLSGLTKGDSAIVEAKHKANIEFSNIGIKASAVTMMGGLGSTGGGFNYKFEVPVEVIDITFDKPYMFLIRDVSTGEVWFVGTVYQPIDKE